MIVSHASFVHARAALAAIAAAALLTVAPASAQSDASGVRDAGNALPSHGTAVRRAEADEVVNAAYEIMVQQLLGLRESTVVALDIDEAPSRPIAVTVPIDGEVFALELQPYSTRAPGYQVLVQKPNGAIVRGESSPVRTLRGFLAGEAGTIAAGSLLEDGLHAMIQLADGERFWIEPISWLIPGAVDRYVIYRGKDVISGGGTCGVPDAVVGNELRDIDGDVGHEGEGAAAAGGVCIAELACDADTEYYNDYGTVSATEARINSVINTCNVQYESQVGITHQITTIIVRTGSDPYTSTAAQTRLCQFITEWTNNQTGIQRDVAHLFTGVEIDGGTIGIASDIGGTGICVNSGGCSGGTYGTFGSYCLSQSDFNNNFSCATDLTTHELGHLWGAFHCSCSSNTMNPSITCANNFSGGSINSITAYRDTRTCLTGTCTGGPTPPANDLCADAESISCNASLTVSTLNSTPAGGNDSDLPNGSPSCQWQGTPTNTHNTIWYSFLAEDTSIEIQTCNTTSIQDTILALYDGSCGNLTELACGEDQCGGTTYMSSICYNGLTPGNTYLVMVGSPGGWSGSTAGTIELDLTCPCPSVGPVAGACCLSGGGCSDLETSTSCSGQGGTFQGAGTDCAGVTCGGPATEACCLGGGGCQDLDPASCGGAGGTSQGPGTDCTDTDGDGTADACGDACPNDPDKTAPGACGCGVADVDTDGDGTLDCNDGCPNDVNKIAPGDCGCGVPDTDTDGDGTPDCNDGCPNDVNKIAPGDCGCGVPDTDTDGDGTADCIDGCPNDANKIAPGDCGCGVPDTDTDGDGTADCIDGCPNDANKTAPGDCGCGVPDTDSDGDGTPDCNDGCPNDASKTAPGDCGCGVPDEDLNFNGTSDCLETAACCIGTSCSLLTEADCSNAGGVWQGLDTDCTGGPCDVAGPAEAPLSSLQVVQGSLASGSINDLDTSDNSDLCINSSTSGKRRAELVLGELSPYTTVSQMVVDVEAAVNTNKVKTKIYLRRTDNNRWTRFASYTQSQSDSVRTINVSNPNLYVNSTTGAIEIRILTERKNQNYTMCIDNVEVTVTP